MDFEMFLLALNILFVLYVLFSLSTIKHQLKMITQHLNIKEIETQKVSNAEIEKELEEDFKN